jgi:antitoxin ParD1/3/4
MKVAEKFSIELAPDVTQMVKSLVEAGRFGSSSELIGEALRVWKNVDEENQQNLVKLRAHLETSIGDERPKRDVDEVFDTLRLKHEARKLARVS